MTSNAVSNEIDIVGKFSHAEPPVLETTGSSVSVKCGTLEVYCDHTPLVASEGMQHWTWFLTTIGMCDASPQERALALRSVSQKLSEGLDLREFLGWYYAYLTIGDEGYAPPEHPNRDFVDAIENLSGVSYDRFFSPGLYLHEGPFSDFQGYKKKAEDVGEMFDDDLAFAVKLSSPAPNLSFSHPWHTLILDYAWKAYVPDSPYCEYHPSVYAGFIEELKNKGSFYDLILQTCLDSAATSATHPDILRAIDSLKHLPERQEESMSAEVMAKFFQSLAGQRKVEFRRALSQEYVYTTTSLDRYKKPMEAMADAGVFDGLEVKHILDFGSSYAGSTGISLARSFRRAGAVTSEGIDLYCLDGVYTPSPHDYLLPADSFIMGAHGYKAVMTTGLTDLPSEFRVKLETLGYRSNVFPSGWALVACNSVIPHGMDRVAPALKELLVALRPDIAIFYGGFFDIKGFPQLPPFSRWDIIRRTGDDVYSSKYYLTTYTYTEDGLKLADA